jgi:hypothetical protein
MGTVLGATDVKPARTVFGDRRVHYQDFTFSNAYTTGGESLTLAQLGLTVGLSFVQIEPKTVAGTVYRFEYDRATSKVKAYVATTGAEVANGVDLSGVTCRVRSEGK